MPGSAGPVLGLPDGLGGRKLLGVAFDDILDSGFGGGLLVWLVPLRGCLAGDDVGGVGFPASGHADVQGLAGEGVGDQEVGGVDGAALGDVHVAGVAEFGAGLQVGAGNPELLGPGAIQSLPPHFDLSPRMAVILRVSRLVSLRPSASISALSRARIRSPGRAWFPSASGTCAWYPPLLTWPAWMSLAWTRRARSAASSLDPASRSTSLPRRWSASHAAAARSRAVSASAALIRPCRS